MWECQQQLRTDGGDGSSVGGDGVGAQDKVEQEALDKDDEAKVLMRTEAPLNERDCAVLRE